MGKPNLPLIGLLQALGVIVYCLLISGLLRLAGKYLPQASEFLGGAAILALLVFSAAVSGSLVFGYPAYLALNKERGWGNLVKQKIIRRFYGIILALCAFGI